MRRAVSGMPRVAVIVGDGYRELLAHVPPTERRGVVLIDPPFETEQEFDRVLDALAAALYPLADRYLRGLVPAHGALGQ